MSNKKGQAAMEFLMTYGWAILVVLIALGALFYLGVFNPKTTNTGSVPAPFSYIDHKVTALADGDTIVLGANSISGTPTLSFGTGPCIGTVLIPHIWAGTFDGNGQNTITLKNCATTAGDKYTGSVDITYTLVGSSISHTVTLDYSGTSE